jgi:hypothetical protein
MTEERGAMSVQGVLPERKVIALLDSVHLKYLSEAETRILAALEFGYAIGKIAAGLERSEATINRHVADLKSRVFDFIDLDPSTTLPNHWTRRHLPCCTREVKRMIENCQILSGGAHNVS